jgi:hypothetical protein
MLGIYIPTLRRVNNQITYRFLPSDIQKKTTLVVDHSERGRYPAHMRTLVCPPRCDHIGKVRQFIVDQHDVARLGPKLIMLDDDLNFSRRCDEGGGPMATRKRRDTRTLFLSMRPGDWETMFRQIEKLLDDHVHVAVRHREMAQDEHDVEYCVRALRALAYDVRELRRLKVRFDRMTVMEDFDVTLRLLRMGHPNAVISTFVQNQRASGSPGGCSTYRTMETQKQGALALARAHPDFVKVVTKQTKAIAWNAQERMDVEIQWKKAYLSSGKEFPR